LGVAARLGITSFGGLIAHLGYFHEEYVVRRKWIDERSYADLVALCQMIPGPASSQLGIAIGIERAGIFGGVAAWSGFTLPSALALVGFALLVHGSGVVTCKISRP
jgi:chromate transporter